MPRSNVRVATKAGNEVDGSISLFSFDFYFACGGRSTFFVVSAVHLVAGFFLLVSLVVCPELAHATQKLCMFTSVG